MTNRISFNCAAQACMDGKLCGVKNSYINSLPSHQDQLSY